MNRTLQKIQTQIQPAYPVGSEFENDPREWLIKQAKQNNLKFLLAYADDGVIWGQFEGDQLQLAGDRFAEVNVSLSAQTLQQARLFSDRGELLIWNTQPGWTGRLIQDGAGKERECFDEPNWLWGWVGELGDVKDGFTLLVEGKQGLRHAPPIPGLGKDDRVALKIRHYVGYDDNQARVEFSRLIGLDRVPDGGKR